MNSQPLVVDLDGTLVHTDMLHETSLRVLRDRPWDLLRLSVWLSQGKAVVKRNLAERAQFDPQHLPYNEELLHWLKEQKAAGRTLVLCTASDMAVAEAVASHLGIFDEVMGSDGSRNLGGKVKAEALVTLYGERGFDYVGNSTTDLAVWRHARRAVVVNGSTALAQKAGQLAAVEKIFERRPQGLGVWRRVLRAHQWLKNLLLFVPVMAAHQFSDANLWVALAVAFVSFSLCASSVYIFNDLLDLESDRAHPRKRARPFAAGLVPVWMGLLLGVALLVASCLLARKVGGTFFPWLGFYFVLTCAYSWTLKRLMLVDCLALAMLYTVRIVAGAAAAGLSLSFWLLAFAVFLFLSLAFVKRYAELEVQIMNGKTKVHGRGYYTTDAPLIQTLGVTAGYGAVLVLALYLNSEAVLRLYATPEVMWAAVPVLLFWVSWMWMQAHRGLMHDDPLVFAVKDRASLAAGLAFGVVLALGTVGWSG
ncbi:MULTISPECIES: UbiA family prenyltransferase [Ramlibacter]|uniref:UbiA family prenyltransferase n=1 Tax=Ramlibacter aquaticus TaxID=2780094 RepID=A0ABR9SIP8_9BURK|nr:MULTISPECIES: UbiA family prenyltransferase [Ramlibacter]MBE7942220.1 UbiA family prenyltransferase [Ramlibacter aquaticus]